MSFIFIKFANRHIAFSTARRPTADKRYWQSREFLLNLFIISKGLKQSDKETNFNKIIEHN